MIKNIFVLFVLCLSGCIVLIEEEPTTDNQDYVITTDMWIYDARIQCSYDYYYRESYWDLSAEIGSSYVYYTDEVTVGVYLDGWDYYDLQYEGYDWWSLSVIGFFTCEELYYADFVVSDYYGNYDEVTVWW